MRRWPSRRVAPLLAAAIGLMGAPARAASVPPGPSADEARVPAGRYYVGRATGALDYGKLANASTPGYLVARGQVTQALWGAVTAWGEAHGYVFETACNTCQRDAGAEPLGGVSWRDAALLANALSEMDGLDPVYRDGAGQPIRSAVPPGALDHAVVEPSLTGFRLPTIPEWQIAMRGADRAMAAGTYGAAPASPNALGLTATAGPLAEWTASSLDRGDGPVARFVCDVEVDGVRALSQCEGHPTGWAGPEVGVRLVRRAPPEAPPIAMAPAAKGANTRPDPKPPVTTVADGHPGSKPSRAAGAGSMDSKPAPVTPAPAKLVSAKPAAATIAVAKPSVAKPSAAKPSAIKRPIATPSVAKAPTAPSLATRPAVVAKPSAPKAKPLVDPDQPAPVPRG